MIRKLIGDGGHADTDNRYYINIIFNGGKTFDFYTNTVRHLNGLQANCQLIIANNT